MSWGSYYILWSSYNHSANMSSPLSDFTIVKQCSVIPFLWLEGVIHRITSAQYGKTVLHKRRCTIGWKPSKVADKCHWWRLLRLSDHKQHTVLNKLCSGLRVGTYYCHWYSLQVGHQLWNHLFHHPQHLGYHKICAGWLPKQLTNGQVWKCACNFCSNIMKKRLSSNELSQMMKQGAPPWTCKQMSKHVVETCIIAQDQEIQKCAFCQQNDVNTILGLQWAYPQALPGSWTDGQ
jgi:hypothetical protein